MYLRQAISIAAQKLAQEGKEPFTSQDLAVEVWGLDKAAFGLPGFADCYPDHHAVLSALSGQHGSVRVSEIIGCGNNRFRAGKPYEDRRTAAKRVGKNCGRARTDASHLSDHLRRTAAWGKWQSGQKSQITMQDAEQFWGKASAERAGEITLALRRMDELPLLHCHEWMVGRFESRLAKSPLPKEKR